MRYSKILIPTQKEAPSDAKLVSHILMVRAGLMRKVSDIAGFYTYLPLGVRVLRKVEAIIREEMHKIDAEEFIFPLLLPRTLWEKTGRWKLFKDELFRLSDRHNHDFALASTHEEAFTDLFRMEVSSYKNLPRTFYQMHTKFRDEIRPRFGVMRCREFVMKDAYSFHLDDHCLHRTYVAMGEVYASILKRCNLDFVRVQADSGVMGGSASEEFMVKSTGVAGEETLLVCGNCNYAANIETAIEHIVEEQDRETKSLMKVYTPTQKTIEELTAFFNVKANRFIKSILYVLTADDDKTPIECALILIRGDYAVNVVKLAALFAGNNFRLARDVEIQSIFNCEAGFLGPIFADGLKHSKSKLPFKVYADVTIRDLKNAYTGANESGYHYQGVNIGRDFSVQEYHELYTARSGGLCSVCDVKANATLSALKGIEVGHIFKLGKKYTNAFKVDVLSETGQKTTPTMGCYGIGVTRLIAAIIEQHHDKSGIVWPIEVAPFKVYLIAIESKKQTNGTAEVDVLKYAHELYKTLRTAGLEPLWDDRVERVGVKFKDADLLGIPYLIVVSDKTLAEDSIELIERKTQKRELVKISSLTNAIISRMQAQ